MKINDYTDHRPYSIPHSRWIMLQTWHDLIFAHFPVSIETLRPLIPASLEIDTFEGRAWVGLCSYKMEGIHLRGIPISLFRSFSGINVRTYVLYNGKPGVYFINLFASNWLALNIAKLWYHLPYRFSQIDVHKNRNESIYRMMDQIDGKTMFQINYSPEAGVFHAKKGTIEYWLMERYCLYSVDSKNKLHCGEIHHKPWALQKAQGEIIENRIMDEMRIIDDPLFLFSKECNSFIWNIERKPSFTSG